MSTDLDVDKGPLAMMDGLGADPLEDLARLLLKEIGEDPSRDGLRDTPARYARWWREFIEYDPGTVDTVFEATSAGQLVLVSGIEVWSLCEHHLLPFNCSLTIGYRAADRLLGLSKFARIAHHRAHRLQVQERLVADIAADVARIAGTEDVGVIGTGEHLCMTMRGIKTSARMTSSSLLGAFAEEGLLRSELLTHLQTAR
ncbi:GTP cyclohydrolase I [Actinoplanes teichomyceticus]|uniref:GTP cyclohydrolase 1 n=1 Tax=Actinoplanes teichomyceticus TaxID=1867 RepID=A0A561WQZ7_ACTTI|nr:GTP cyclohydrolase I [Actinoplanes teichomyceticus]TWG26290.1 GTP cyclohydrolase I [Actinoplanes teichomyceticus]GIF11369.1 GTP cyclohydrolase 1 [Actinoplanes teichomyceticus]